MGRLLLFLELAAAACAVGFFSLWGTVSPALAITPIAIVVFIPLVAALGVWPPRVLARALLDGWGSDPLRKPAPQSAAIWRFLERMVPLSGAIGVGIFAVLTLSSIPVGGRGEAATTIARRASSLIGLCGADAAGVFLVIRAVRQTVDLLQRRETTGAASKLPEAALSRYSISERESEVAVLLLSGLRYDEIADRLFISTKTVKTHVHRLYQKTGTRNRMELAICLRV